MKTLLTLALVTASACTLNAEKLPLDLGNSWTYRSASTGETFTIRVGAPVWMQTGRTYHFLSGYTATTILARFDERGNLVALDNETGEELLVTGFGFDPDQWWKASARACQQEGQILKDHPPYNGPGGRWDATVAVAYRNLSCADTGAQSEQFVDNIGMVQRVVTTIAGPRAFDLVHARVGPMLIEPMNRGRFMVTVAEHPEGQGWDVTLRLDLGSVPGILLAFDTAQEYDVVLRDNNRKVLWQWSQGQFFAQVHREKMLGGHWAETVFVPRPPNLTGNLDGFTIDAWLTTAADQPKFAASAPFPLPELPN